MKDFETNLNIAENLCENKNVINVSNHCAIINPVFENARGMQWYEQLNR